MPYLVDYFFGLLAAIVSDVLTTAALIAAVFLGLAFANWWLAGAFFFTLYALFRVGISLANAIGSVGQNVGQALSQPPPTPQFPSVQTNPSPGPYPEDAPVQRIPVTFPSSEEAPGPNG